MTENESFNPYEAPEVQEQDDVRLDEDSEFLISTAEILCRETVSLPKVCIHTGESDNLLQRQATFHSPRIPVGAIIVLLFIVAGRFAGALEVLILIFAASILYAAMRRFAQWKLPGITKLDVTWYVNSDYCQRCHRQQWIIRSAVVLVAFLGGFAGAHGMTTPGWPTSMSDAGLTAVTSAVFFGGLSLFLRMERRLRYSGRRRRGPHQGLFSLTGHSRRFAETVERIIHGGF